MAQRKEEEPRKFNKGQTKAKNLELNILKFYLKLIDNLNIKALVSLKYIIKCIFFEKKL